MSLNLVEFIHRNIFSDSDCEEVAERLQENSTTMGKMNALRQQMEKLSLQKVFITT